MFFQGPNQLPSELMLNILNRLPAKDAISFLSVSKEMRGFIKDDSVWKKFGAKNFEDFVKRMKLLPEDFRRFILKGQYSYTLALAEEIMNILFLPKSERDNQLFTDEQWNANHVHWPSMILMTSNKNGVIALKEKLITLDQLIAMPKQYLEQLLTNEGISALREGLIKPEQAAAMPAASSLALFLMDDIQNALREGLITPKQAAAMPDPGDRLSFLLGMDDSGKNALIEGLVTPEQIAAMPTCNHVDRLMSDKGINALRQGLITVEQIVNIKNPEDVSKFIDKKISESKSPRNPFKKQKP